MVIICNNTINNFYLAYNNKFLIFEKGQNTIFPVIIRYILKIIKKKQLS